jgi:hypothetical protein
MVSIGCRSSGVKGELQRLLPIGQIERLARKSGHHWRQRKLGPAATAHLWILQVLLCNLSSVHARHLRRGGTGGTGVSISAICQAKLRLPLKLLVRLNRYLIRQLDRARNSSGARWRGHRVFGGDGVCYYTPDTSALRKRLGSRKQFGYPLLKAVTLVDLGSGAIVHQIPLPQARQEAPLVGRLLRHLAGGDVLILDRAFASFWNLLQGQCSGVHLLIRLKKNLWAGNSMRRTLIKHLGKQDLLVQWKRPRERATLSLRRWVGLPRQLILRQISITVRRRGYRTRHITVITTLLDPIAYPAHEVAQLYARRWEIETAFRHLKQTLNLEHLRCRTVAGIRKELLIRALAYNLVRATMQRAAGLRGCPPSQVSFADTLQWLLLAGGGDDHLRWILINRPRPGRVEPRRLKRQRKNYLPLNCTRAQARRQAA